VADEAVAPPSASGRRPPGTRVAAGGVDPPSPVDGPGEPLPGGVRAAFEPQLGADLARVRVHAGPAAAASAWELGARAYTVGRHVVFGPNAYAPGTSRGDRLLAHELAHVVQQARGEAPPIAQRAPEEPGTPAPPPAPAAATSEAAKRVTEMIADGDSKAIQQASDDVLAASEPRQRAGMIKILTDLTWTDADAERAIVRLLAYGGQNAKVAEVIDALGYRSKVLDAVDDDALHAEVTRLLGTAPSPAATGPVAAALASGKPADVMAITAFSAATGAQRLGLLRILLDMRWSNAAEEAKMLDILASAGNGLRALMADLTAAGLKQSLFDHIDAAPNKALLKALLVPLEDDQLTKDLAVFDQGFWAGVGDTFVGGVKSAWREFSIGKAIKGLIQPIIHPIDELMKLFQQVEDLAKDPSLDRLLTVLRDVTGFIATWLGTLALIAGGLALLLGSTIVLIPGAAPIGVIAGSLAADAAAMGIAFLVLAALKTLVDLGRGGAATTARERQRTQQAFGEDFALLATLAVFAGMIKRLKFFLGKFRGAAVDRDKADPKKLEEDADDAKKTEKENKEGAKDLKSRADGKPPDAKPDQQSGQKADPAADAASARARAARAAFAAEIGLDAESLEGFTEEEIVRLRQLLPDRHPNRVAGMRNYLSDQVAKGRHTRNILDTLERMDERERARFLDERASFKGEPDWRGGDPPPRLEDGNADEGWIHVERRHVTGADPGGDLFRPGTTRAQIFDAAAEVIRRGTRISPRGRRIQVFERSLYVNDQRDLIRVTVDTADGRIITVFPVRGGGP